MRNIKMIASMMAIAGFIVGAGIYLGLMLAQQIDILPLWAWVMIVIISAVGSIVVMMRSVTQTAKRATILYRVSGIYMMIVLYRLLALGVIDLLERCMGSTISGSWMIALTGSILLTGYGIWRAFDIRITHQTLPVAGLTNEVTIIHLTDTHFGHTRGAAQAQKIVNLINALAPDMVCFTGDMFDSPRALDEDIFALFGSIYVPVYFIEGNHDVHVGADPIKQAMKDYGIYVLDNNMVHHGEWAIIGLNHMNADAKKHNVHVRDTKHTVQSTIEKLKPDSAKPTILLHHSPDGLQYAADAGVDLFLTGHTHGGQMFPITLLAQLMFTYNKGCYKVDNMHAYVCSGTGTFGPPVRIGTTSELCVIQCVPIV